MTMKNKYAKRAKISERKFKALLRLFAADIEAVTISELTGLNRNTVNRYFKEIRLRIAQFCEMESPFNGDVEVDESYFGAKRVKGKRGRGAGRKTIVFGILKRNGKVYTEIIPDCAKDTLQGIIRGKVDPESVIHSDGWRGYNGLVDLGYQKHFRVNHDDNEFANDRTHINGIESFWGYAKTRLSKFRGIPQDRFYLYLKETEFRFNYRNERVYKMLLTVFRRFPLF
jgi:transposase